MKNEYLQTRFRCEQKELPAAFFVVTAHNPEGETVDDIANQMANEQLRSELESLDFKNFHVTGGNSDFSHAESGYGIVCTREEALRLAQEFRQDAIFEVREGKVFLVSAEDSTELIEEIGLWVELIEQPKSTKDWPDVMIRSINRPIDRSWSKRSQLPALRLPLYCPPPFASIPKRP